MEKQFFAFGDSITYGAIDREGGWTARLRAYLDNRMVDSNLDEFYMLYNLGVSGNTTVDLLARFETELKARLDKSEETTVLFAIGINDSQSVGDGETALVKIEEFTANIQKLYEQAKQLVSHVVFIGITNVDETKTMPVAWDKNCFYKNTDIRAYDEILSSFCERNKITFIRMQDILDTTDLADGLHPNTQGFKKMTEVIRLGLEAAKII